MSKRRDAEELFAIAFDQAGIVAGIIDLAGIPIRVNAAVCDLLGRPSHELVGREQPRVSTIQTRCPSDRPCKPVGFRAVTPTQTNDALCDPTGPSCGVRCGGSAGTRRANLSTT